MTGLAAEAKLLADFNVLVCAAGTGVGESDAAALKLINCGATALVSFGFAGGLDPILRPGSLVIPNHVTDGAVLYRCDEALVERFGGSTVDLLTGAGEIAATICTKAVLYRTTGAAAVDMESVAVARVALANGVPFAVMRAVSDPADRDLPPASLVAIDQLGRLMLVQVLASLLRQPAQLVDLVRLASNAAAARRTLSKHADRVFRDL